MKGNERKEKKRKEKKRKEKKRKEKKEKKRKESGCVVGTVSISSSLSQQRRAGSKGNPFSETAAYNQRGRERKIEVSMNVNLDEKVRERGRAGKGTGLLSVRQSPQLVQSTRSFLHFKASYSLVPTTILPLHLLPVATFRTSNKPPRLKAGKTFLS